jgi:hypothetical protein
MTTRKILVATPTAPIAIDVNSSAAVSVTLSGARGANGYGVPVGGDAGAVLAKSATGDYLTSWLTTTAFGRGLLVIADAAGLRSAAGLANVDNTADASKPVSTAQALAISAAVAAEATLRSSGDSSEAGTRAAADTALDGRLDVLEADPITATAVASGLSGKAALSHTHAIADTTGLQTAIDAKAPLASPALTGTPTSPTAVDGTSTTQIASTAFVQSAVGAEATIRSGADTALDGRLDTLEADPITATAVASGLAGKLAIASNLGDLNNAATARTNLGLGSLATQSGTFSGTSSGINTGDQTIALTGDVTGSGSGSFTATVAANAITNAKAAQMAAGTIKGNNTGATASASDLTAAQVRGVMALPTSTVAGRLARYTDTAGAQGQTAGLFEDASGNVGIGTTNPGNLLHLASSNPVIRVEDTDGGYSTWGGNGGHLTFSADVGNAVGGTRIAFETDGTEKVRIDSNGKVGIGTTAPRVKLDVSGPVAVGSYSVATVPSAALGAGQIIYVSSESGGATLAFSDGTSWRRTTDRAVIS